MFAFVVAHEAGNRGIVSSSCSGLKIGKLPPLALATLVVWGGEGYAAVEGVAPGVPPRDTANNMYMNDLIRTLPYC